MALPQRSHFRSHSNYWLAVASEVLRFPATLAIRLYFPKATPPSSWRRGLILGASHIGDILYRTSSLKPLVAGLPNCKWYYLVEEGTAPLLKGFLPIEQLITYRGTDSGYLPKDIISEAHRHFQFDVVLCTSGVAYWKELLVALRLRIQNRCAFVYKGFSALVTHPIVSDRLPCPTPIHFREQVAGITNTLADWEVRPHVFSDKSDHLAEEMIRTKYALQKGGFCAFSITTRQKTCTWPLANWKALAELIWKRLRLKIALLGSAGDTAILRQFSENSEEYIVPIVGELSLTSIVPFLKNADFFVGTDSGVRHLANAANIPVFFFRNLNSHEIETGQYLDSEHDLVGPGSYIDLALQPHILANSTPELVLERIAWHMRKATEPTTSSL